jgi:UDP-N-acetyl-2-amino-2-deoxyglucuronate dehydrogenase
MNKIKFGVVGFGNIGKRHVQHILNNDEAQLVAICDEKSIEEKIDGVHYFTSLETMLQEENIDVVNVCTPNYLHHAHTILSLQYKKHVVCEKPMAISVAQCNEMIEAATENAKTIFVVKQNRFNEPVQQVKKLMNENVLGNIYFININCFWNRNEYYYNESNWRGKKDLDGGCLFTQFSHFIDILYYLFGEIKNVKGLMKNFNHTYTEVEDSGSFVMETMQGAIVNFNFSTCSFEKNMEGAITILGENGTVKIGGQYLNTIEYQHIKAVQLPEINIVAKSNDYGKYQGSMSNHDKIISNVINTLQGKDTIMTNATEGMQVVKIIEEMYSKSS